MMREEEKPSLAVGHSSSQKPQEGESEGNTEKAVAPSLSHHLPRTCVRCYALYFRGQGTEWQVVRVITLVSTGAYI